MARATVAETIAGVLSEYGVARVFGVPGGGSNLEIIDACARRGIDYVLAHTETAAAIMAAVTGEMTGAPGVVATGLGPGAAAAVNGVAYAALDRAPLLVLTDCYDPRLHAHVTHQKVDHSALFAPLTKARGRATADNAAPLLHGLLRAALTPPFGPAHCDLSASDAAAPVRDCGTAAAARGAELPKAGPSEAELDAARALLAGARRPAIVAGAQARRGGAEALATLAAALACPVLTTYKAKGVYADGAPRHAGLFTGGAAEAPWLAECDLAILFGVDPVELVASPWPYSMPVLELATAVVRPHYTDIAVSLEGELAALVEEVASAARPANWPLDPRPAPLPEAPAAAGSLSPRAVARAAAAALPDARATVDAGAHMLAPMSVWPARRPFDAQISNGLSTMGFALPAAIAAALAEPGRRVVAFTGDGGLAMCLGELATAARHALPITVVVFNDARLALIDAKQAQRGFAPRGMRYPALDFVAAAQGLGCCGLRARDPAELEAAFADARGAEGPFVIDAVVDPSGYRAMFEAVRGAPAAAARV